MKSSLLLPGLRRKLDPEAQQSQTKMFRHSIQQTSLSLVKNSSTPQLQICDDAYCEATQKYRNLLDHFLECIGKDWDMDLRMNHQGICFFQYKQFVIVVEAPKESASFFVYTCVLRCTYTSTAVMKRALEMNYLTQESCGCTLGLDPSCEDDNALEVTLSYSQPIMGLNRGELCNIVMNFMHTASYIHCQLSGADSQLDAPCEQPKYTFTRANQEEPKAPAPFQPPPPHHAASETSTPENEAVTPILSNKSSGPKPLDRARQDQSSVRHLNPKFALAKKSSLQNTFTKMTQALGRSTSKISTPKKVPKGVTFAAQANDAFKVTRPDTNTFKVIKPEIKRHSSCCQMDARGVAPMYVSKPGLPRRASVRPVLMIEI